ncbi:hypothetical protein [Nocardioides sp. Arc9.136]|uniref:hypothetical protein n=1 Tax=Nocardioides sp. Arc9.136 TaxID=2996826 RepID=UPI0026665052|nr:hypothetical protein [Nocardioides sp. Arc9.136]WKN46991.1 hypothetical protein OSR43_13185 [Nocardioides sp. Arc9.136]
MTSPAAWPAPPVPPPDGALVSAFRSLWPRATLAEGSAGAWALVPSARTPRLVVPVGSRLAAARSLCRFSTDTSLPQAVRRVVGAAVVGTTRGAVLGTRVEVTGASEDSFARHLEELLGHPVVFSVGVGSERVNRKPVLQVFDTSGHTVAFVKIGDSEVSRVDVAAEGAHLRRVGAVPLELLRVPRVLHESVWHGRVVLVLEPLPTGRPRLSPLPPAPPAEAMAELASAFAEAPGTLRSLPWWARQRRAAADLADPAWCRRLHDAMDRVEEASGDHVWSVGAWHGDWTPWNMARARGRVQLWDWERFETGVPHGLDRLHFAVNVATTRRGTTPATVLQAVTAPATAREDRPGPRGVLAAAYLVAVTERYLTLASSAQGAAIRDRGLCTLTALEDLLDR